MAAKKIEGGMDSVEERVAEVHGEVQRGMESVQSELQRLVPLEKSVELLLGRMSVLDRMDRWLQKVEESNLSVSSSEGQAPPTRQAILDPGKAVDMGTTDFHSPVVIEETGQNSRGGESTDARGD